MYNKITVNSINKNYKFMIMFAAIAIVLSLFFAACATEDAGVEIVESTTTTTTEPEIVTTTTTEAPPTTEAYIPPTTTTQYVEPAPVAIPEAIEEPVAIEIPTGSIEEMICNTFGDQCQKALSVAWCESRYNPGTVGAAGERGLMQIHPVHIQYLGNYGLTWDDMFDPAANLTYAYALYSSQGWGPWTCA